MRIVDEFIFIGLKFCDLFALCVWHFVVLIYFPYCRDWRIPKLGHKRVLLFHLKCRHIKIKDKPHGYGRDINFNSNDCLSNQKNGGKKMIFRFDSFSLFKRSSIHAGCFDSSQFMAARRQSIFLRSFCSYKLNYITCYSRTIRKLTVLYCPNTNDGRYLDTAAHMKYDDGWLELFSLFFAHQITLRSNHKRFGLVAEA